MNRTKDFNILGIPGCPFIQRALLIFAAVAACLGSRAATTDSLSLRMEEADSIFLQHNFALLAQRYQVNADQAMVRQAKLWDNPNFSTELGMRSITHPKFLDVGKNGEVAYNIEQVIQIAGQRNKNVRLAQMRADYSGASFDALVNTLKLALHTSFIDLFYKQRTLSILKKQGGILDNIILAYRHADSTGSVAHADYIRLLSLQVNLKNDYLSTVKDVFDDQATLQQLMGITEPIQPVVHPGSLNRYQIDRYTLANLMDTAMVFRSDLKLAHLDQSGSKLNYALQRAMAVPDLHIGAAYDSHGSYIDNYWGLTVGIDLPLWNRNQGNIKAAKFMALQTDQRADEAQNKTYSEVQSAYGKVMAYEQSFQKADLETFSKSYDELINSVATNFTKGNITLLQFIDYFNSYSDNVQDLNAYYASLYEAYESLSNVVGTELFR